MSDTSLTNRFTARRVAIFVAAACILLALLTWLRRRDALAVLVTTDQATVGPGGQAHIEASLVRKKSGDAAPASAAEGCKYKWTATMGAVTGSGAAISWNAPSVPDASATVSVVVQCGDELLNGGIDLATESARPSGFVSERHYGGPAAAPAVAAKDPEQKHEGDDAPVIDEITVEKTSVCRGEDDLVSVRAHDPKTGESQWIRTTIGPGRGTAVPIVYNTEVKDPPYRIIVSGNFGRGTTYADVPHVTVMDCEAPWRVAIQYRLIANTQDDFHFMARVIPKPGGQAFEACSYEWDFGDEQSTSTSEPFSEHSFLNRPQVGLDSTFVVAVRLVACDGSGTVTGRTALTLNNLYAVQKAQKHISGLVIVGDPRYPKRGDDNVVRQTALFRTFESSPVTITKITYVDTTEGVMDPGPPHDVAVSSFLGTTTLGGDWTRVSLTMNLDDNPGWMMRRWDLEGRSSDGDLVMGSFTLMKPPNKVDRDKSAKIADPAMKSRIMAAMRILGKDQVSEEDMLALEEQGKIPKLKDPQDHIPRPPEPDYVQKIADKPPDPAKAATPAYVPPEAQTSDEGAGTSKPR